MNVLIVDDSRVMRTKLKGLINASGLPVEHIFEAGDGREALDLMANQSVDAVFTDINMPQMDGREFVREMHERQLAPYAVKIVCTTEGLDRLRDDFMRYGVNLYIEKPFDVETVRQALLGVGKMLAV